MAIQRTPLKPNSLTCLKNFYPKFFPKNCKMFDPGTILNYVQNLTKYAMATEAEVISSIYVDQNFLFQYLMQNIDKIKGATLYVLSSRIFPHMLGMI